MTFIEKMKQKSKQDIKTIVLPEAEDLRVLKASEKIIKEGFAKERVKEENSLNPQKILRNDVERLMRLKTYFFLELFSRIEIMYKMLDI